MFHRTSSGPASPSGHRSAENDAPLHTPTPWRVDPLSYWIVATNVPKGPMHVADIRGWGYLTGKGHGALGMDEDDALEIQKANADFIVKAVNNHDALMKALRELVNYGSTLNGWDDARKYARQVLADVEASGLPDDRTAVEEQKAVR